MKDRQDFLFWEIIFLYQDSGKKLIRRNGNNMSLEPNIELQKRLLNWSRFLLGCVFIMASYLMLGHLLNIHFLIRPLFGSPSMGFLSAFSFILCSHSINEKSGIRKVLARILDSIVLVISILQMNGQISGTSFEHDHSTSVTSCSRAFSLNLNIPMPFISAICFASRSISIVYLNFETAVKKMCGQILSLITAGIGLLSLIGYLYLVKSFNGLGNYNPMSMGTAVWFLLVSLAVLYATPGRGIMREISSIYNGSFSAWSLMPFAIVNINFTHEKISNC